MPVKWGQSAVCLSVCLTLSATQIPYISVSVCLLLYLSTHPSTNHPSLQSIHRVSLFVHLLVCFVWPVRVPLNETHAAPDEDVQCFTPGSKELPIKTHPLHRRKKIWLAVCEKHGSFSQEYGQKVTEKKVDCWRPQLKEKTEQHFAQMLPVAASLYSAVLIVAN